MFGFYHPFLFVERVEDIEPQIVHKIDELKVIFTGQIGSVSMVNALTGAVTSPSISSLSWELEGVTVEGTRVSASLVSGVHYYLIVDSYYSDLFTQSSCNKTISTYNNCANQFWDWGSDSFPLTVYLNNASELSPIAEKESITTITDKGKITKVKSFTPRYRIEFLAPCGTGQILESLTLNSGVSIDGVEIANIEIEDQKQDNERYSVFVINYRLKNDITDGSGCCELINIDDLLNPDNNEGSEACAAFLTAIVNTADTLTVTLTDPPSGTPTYKWYRNGVYISSASSLAITTPGNYKVDVKVATCKSSASYFKDDECNIYQLELTKVNNDINGTVSNEPDGETTTYSVVLNGVEVSTTLPYTALATGNYYVYATAGECKKLKGIYVELVDDDCDFTIDITVDDNAGTLTAVTDALTPVYLWELETGTGRVTVGTANEINIGAKGIYWLTITQGTCSKETYIYKEPLTESGIFARYGGTGTEFTVLGINLLSITNYAGTIRVTVNGVQFNYVAGAPGLNQYSVNVTGQVVVGSTLTNPSIIIELI